MWGVVGFMIGFIGGLGWYSGSLFGVSWCFRFVCFGLGFGVCVVYLAFLFAGFFSWMELIVAGLV